MGLIKIINHILYVYGFETLFKVLSYVKAEIKIYSYFTFMIRLKTHVYVYKALIPHIQPTKKIKKIKKEKEKENLH